ncbi:MAG: DUF3344 domain-containing protein [Methanolinea sp.]|nr:DUF3344 domain-containing protein [Methanolinea sp.]
MRGALVVLLVTLVLPCSAVYDFEGLPFRTVARGEVAGNVIVAGNYGLTAPPAECTVTLDSAPRWARIYCGVWGGTERYTGWARITVNGRTLEQIPLYGQDDRSEGVYCSGHGVYWIARDATALLRQGENTIGVATSRGEAGSKIDGRVFCVAVVAVVEADGGDATRYIVLEGNENLHGEGWSGTNPTRKDRVEIPLEGMPASGVRWANLSVILVATNRGQPDYVAFNGVDLGVPPPAGILPAGTRDIGNEQSMDACGGEGFSSRYVDVETFDVASLLREDNLLTFERGRDTDGDGTIMTSGAAPEGEDYIHPCLAVLAVGREGPVSPPSLAFSSLEVRNAYAGERAEITAEIWNAGGSPGGPVEVTFLVDGTRAGTARATLSPAGRADVAFPWDAAEGVHTIALEATAPGAAPAYAQKTVKVGTPADLAVSLGQPVRRENAAAARPTSPFPVTALAGGAAIGLWLCTRRGRPVPLLVAVATVAVLVPVPAAWAAPAGGSPLVEYILPVEIRNTGGSDSPPFSVTVTLDGERVAKWTVAGIPSGGTVREAITIHAVPGRHSLVVIADEEERVAERNRENNRIEGTYEFP